MAEVLFDEDGGVGLVARADGEVTEQVASSRSKGRASILPTLEGLFCLSVCMNRGVFGTSELS